MKKRVIVTVLAAAALLTVVFYAAPFQGTSRPLAELFPAGPVLYLEAKDFSAELRAWDNSAEKRRWLESARYEGFERSNLFLKLQTAGAEFAGAAGFPADSKLVESLAGGQSALALYDIGNLEFLYITHIPSARAMQTALWQSRAKYETRHAGGVDFFVRVESGRTVVFASVGDTLMLGTREELVAGALRLLAGESLTPVRQEAWYADTTASAAAPGDLRLVMNLEALVKLPQFRSYWIQRNASEIRNYRAGIADLVRTKGEIREERVFLRRTPTVPIVGNAETLLRLAPADAAYCRAWVAPSAGEVSGLIEQKLLTPTVTPPESYDYAPTVDVSGGTTGAESDLETRIDEPPLASQSNIVLDDLGRLMASVPLDAVLEVQSGEALPDGVFVETPTVLAIAAKSPWDSAAARNALTTAAASLWTAAGSGTGWVAHQRGAHSWYSMDGLAQLQVAAEGNLLLLANSAEALGQVLDRLDTRATASDAVSVALFRRQAARDNYRKMMTLLDHAGPTHEQGAPFFSVDLWSLNEVFDSMAKMEMRRRDAGASLRETVTYRMR